jgi:CDP-glucose 4,6-dehydratase
MENVEIEELFGGIYKGRTVLITGHTGFKGSWLALWLRQLGARVVGYALKPPTVPSHSALLRLPVLSVTGDIRDLAKLRKTFLKYQPEIIFHLAAQPLVRYSYKNPLETFETNIIGTVNVFEAARVTKSVQAIVNVTSDKCYENAEGTRAHREEDHLGGCDPYSASKACSEIVTFAYRRSFFNPSPRSSNRLLLASARAGNVLGGGDWAKDRLIPDVMRAVNRKRSVPIRNFSATRPWQHVLEPLSGYLQLGSKLLKGESRFAEAWNFGPANKKMIRVSEVLAFLKKEWPQIAYHLVSDRVFPEAKMLRLNCSKAHSELSWRPAWGIERCLQKTAAWYKDYYTRRRLNSDQDLRDYIRDARKKKLAWTA